MAEIQKYSVSSNIITVYVSGLDSSYSRNDRTVTWYINNSMYGTQSIGAQISSTYSNPYTFYGLNPETSYSIKAKITYTTGGTVTTDTSGGEFSPDTNFDYVYSSYNASNGLHVSGNQTSVVWEVFEGLWWSYTEGYVEYNGAIYYITYQQYTRKGTNVTNRQVKWKEKRSISGGTTQTVSLSSLSVTTGPASSTTRPDKFAWTYDKISGEPFNLTANEWNGLTSNINAVRLYLGYLSYSFTRAVRGQPFQASMYNEVVEAIQQISQWGYVLSEVDSGDPITASCLNSLVTIINLVE